MIKILLIILIFYSSYSSYSCISSKVIKKSIKKECIRKIYSQEERIQIPIILKPYKYLSISPNYKIDTKIYLKSVEYRKNQNINKFKYIFNFFLKIQIKNISTAKVTIESISVSLFFKDNSFITMSKFEKFIIFPTQDKVLDFPPEPYHYHKENPPPISHIKINEYEHYRNFEIKLNNPSSRKKCSFSNNEIDAHFNCKMRTLRIQFEIKNKTKQELCFFREEIIFSMFFKKYKNLPEIHKPDHLVLIKNNKIEKIPQKICILSQKKYSNTFYPLSSIKYNKSLNLYYQNPIWELILYKKLINFIFIIEYGKGLQNRMPAFNFEVVLE